MRSQFMNIYKNFLSSKLCTHHCITKACIQRISAVLHLWQGLWLYMWGSVAQICFVSQAMFCLASLKMYFSVYSFCLQNWEQCLNTSAHIQHINNMFTQAHRYQRLWWSPWGLPGSGQQWCQPAGRWPLLSPRPLHPMKWSSESHWSEPAPVDRDKHNQHFIFFNHRTILLNHWSVCHSINLCIY